jgi:hypothetical protein
MKADVVYGQIKCPKCGYVNNLTTPDETSKGDIFTIPVLGRPFKEVRIELI